MKGNRVKIICRNKNFKFEMTFDEDSVIHMEFVQEKYIKISDIFTNKKLNHFI